MQSGGGTNEYGRFLAEYEGTGRLGLKEGGEVACRFTVFQRTDGQVILLAKTQEVPLTLDAETLIGATDEGARVEVTGLFETNYLPGVEDEGPGTYAAYDADQVTVEISPGETPARSRFALVNLILAEEELTIQHPVARAQLRRLPGYKQTVTRLRTLKGLEVTAELEVEALAPETRETVANDLCYLLSLAQGTKTQWVIREDFREAGSQWTRRHHCSRVTKPYCPMPLVDPREREDTSRYLVQTIPVYHDRRESWRLTGGLIDAYLDAKAEHDYLETRGVKLAVVIEMLKEAFIESTGFREVLRDRSHFRQLVPALKEGVRPVIVAHGFQREERAVVYRNIEALNRVPFHDILAALCEHLGLSVSDGDRRLFVQCRNSLIHAGRFYCRRADEEERAAVPPHEGPVEEYSWLQHFVDRLFLRLVGYRGPYIDWSRPDGEPARRPSF